MKRKRTIAVILTCVFAAASFAFAGSEKGGTEKEAVKEAPKEVVKVRMAHLFGENTSMGEKMTWVANELEKRSGGRFKCELFHGGTAGGEKENLEDLLNGNLELMCGAGSLYAHYVPVANVVELPLLNWQSQEEANRVIYDYWDHFVDASVEKGFYPVAIDTREFFGVWTKKPITSLKEIKGMKFRSVNAELWIEITKLYGAIPNPMPFSEAYMAFKTGVCDGVVNPIGPGVGVGFQEVLKCFIDTRLVLSRSFMLTSVKWLDSLPQDLRDIFLKVNKESSAAQIDILNRYLKSDKQKMLDAGVKFIEYDQIDKGELQDLLERGYIFRDKYMKDKGPEIYQAYKDWIAFVVKETGRPQK